MRLRSTSTPIAFLAAAFTIASVAACSGIDGLPENPLNPSAGDAAIDGVTDAASVDAGDATTTVDAGVGDASSEDASEGDATVDAAPCVAEDDVAFCTRQGKNCGALTSTDNCGTLRTVASCGVCSSYYESCGGGGVTNVCGCTSESDWSFCTRTGHSCGSASGQDNCGQARTVTSCGGACVDAGPVDAGVVDAGAGTDSAQPDSGARDSGPTLLCGRYVVTDVGSATAPGSGAVFDTQTGLTWVRYPYLVLPPLEPVLPRYEAIAFCQRQSRRLPTKVEALAIAGSSFCAAAWPEGWYAYTSSSANSASCASCWWFVGSDGLALDNGMLSRTLCVAP